MKQILEITEKKKLLTICKCPKCGDDFLLKSNTQTLCQECYKIERKEYRIRWNKDNKESINLSKKVWRDNNLEKVSAENKRQYEKNKEYYILRARKYRENNPKKVQEASRRWVKNNPEKVRQIKREWAKNNPEKIKAMRMRDRINNINLRLLNDSDYYIKTKLRHRLYMAFYRYSKFGKVRKSDEYGVDYDAIIKHLGPCPGERKEYHIDHIIPLSRFDFDDMQQIKIAFCPENHQWLKKEINGKKSNKIIIEMIPEKLRTVQILAITNAKNLNYERRI